MKTQRKTPIDILTFIREGTFACFKIGQSKEDVLNCFYPPEDYNGESIENSDYWFYGSFQIHFKDGFIDYFYSQTYQKLIGGNYIELDSWMLNDKESNNVSKIIEGLNKEKIEFSIKYYLEDSQLNIKIIKSNVDLIFIALEDNITDPNYYKFVRIGLTNN